MKDRIPALDGLRGFAILSVLAYHAGQLSSQPRFGQWNMIPSSFLSGGWLGVDLFFVLSGFLITRILISTKEKKDYLPRFLKRRFLRIAPAYFVFVFLSLYILPGTSQHDWFREKQLWFWSYLSNWLFLQERSPNDLLGHLWSIAIEEQFYLMWPFVVLLLSTKRLVQFCVAGILGILAVRLYFFTTEGNALTVLVNTFYRADGLLLGGLVAATQAEKKLKPQHLAWMALPLVLVLAHIIYREGRLVIVSPTMSTYGLSIANALFALGLIRCLQPLNGLSRFFSTKFLQDLGLYSYAIYLWHVFLMNWIQDPYFVTLGPFVQNGFHFLLFRMGFLTTVLALSYCAARLSWYLIEGPIQRWKDRQG